MIPHSSGQEQPAPLAIRAHHLFYLEPAFSRVDIEDYAGTVTSQLKTDLHSSYADSFRINDTHTLRQYATDVIGPNAEGVAERMRHHANFLRLFRDMPADSRVRIISGADDMCNGCYIGEHCQETSDPLARDGEYAHMDYFLKVAGEHGLAAACTQQAKYNNNGTLASIEVITTAAVLRTLFTSGAFEYDRRPQ